MLWYFIETGTLYNDWDDKEDQLIRSPEVGVNNILASLPWTTLNLSILFELCGQNNFSDDFSNSSLLLFSSNSSRYILPINSVNWTFLFSLRDLLISSSILLGLASALGNNETVLSSRVGVELFLFSRFSTEIESESCLVQFSQIGLGVELEEELTLLVLMEVSWGTVF